MGNCCWEGTGLGYVGWQDREEKSPVYVCIQYLHSQMLKFVIISLKFYLSPKLPFPNESSIAKIKGT